MAEAGTLRRYRNPAPSGDARGDWLLSKSEVVEEYIQARTVELDGEGEEA